MRVQLEIGPKGKRVIAVACDWPGLSRGSKTAEDAVATLQRYVSRYAPVAQLAGLSQDYASQTGITVVEDYPGVGSTDFWGISFAFSSIDQAELSGAELDRQISLLQAAWQHFDDVRTRVSAELAPGPRGSVKTRDQCVRHTVFSELDMAKKVGVRPEWEGLLADDRLAAYRQDYVGAIRRYHRDGKPARRWPLRYLIRHTAFHTLDHTWEMEDKDLS
jgi:hypothetical protein